MDVIEEEESNNESSNNQLIQKTKKVQKEQNIGIFPEEFIIIEKIFSLKSQLSSLSFEREGKYLLKKLFFTEDDIKLYKLLLIKGVIPSLYRPEFWFISSGAKREMLRHPNYYKFITEKYPINKISLREEIEIEKDIKRSFPEEEFFRNENNLKKFRNVLNCYFKRNLSGYTQGCNLIMGRILETVKDDEKSLWIFSQLMETVLSVDYYSRMIGIHTDIDIVSCLLRDFYLPELIQKVKKSNGLLILSNTLLKWFVTLFIEHFPKKFQLLVWDLLFIDKKIVLYKVSISLWQKYKYEISQLNSIESFVNFTSNFSTEFNDEIFLKYILFLKKFEFNDEFLDSEKVIIREKRKKIQQRFFFKIEHNPEEKELCNTNWPTCIYDENFRQYYSDVVVYSQLEQCHIVEDYFKYENKNKYMKIRKFLDLTNNNFSNDKLNYDNILIQRRKHFCDKFKKNVKYNVELDIKKAKKNINLINIENNINNDEQEKEGDYIEKKKKYKKMRKYVSNFANYKKLNLKDKDENEESDDDKFEDENIAKYLSKEFINYSRHRIENLRLSKLPNKL